MKKHVTAETESKREIDMDLSSLDKRQKDAVNLVKSLSKTTEKSISVDLKSQKPRKPEPVVQPEDTVRVVITQFTSFKYGGVSQVFERGRDYFVSREIYLALKSAGVIA